MALSKSEWTDWKQHNITRAYFHAADQRIEEVKEILSNTAGQDQEQDNFMRGFVAAYREMLDFRVEDVQDED